MDSSSSFPPGPRGIPVFGSMLSVQPYAQRAFKKWSLEDYGPILSVNMGSRKQVILNTVDTIKQAFIAKGALTSGRPKSYLINQKDGIIFLDNSIKIRNQKDFGQSALQSLAADGKMEQVIVEEGNAFLQTLESVMEKPVDLVPIALWMSGNILSSLLFGKRYSYDSKDTPVNRSLTVFGDDFKKLVTIEHIPWFRHLPTYSSTLRGYQQRRKAVMDAIRSIVEEHKQDFDEGNLKDFIDFYIKEERSGENSTEKGFTDDQLTATINDLLGAGITNPAITLIWMILCALLYPESYKMIVKEVDEVLGKEDDPSWKTRLKMPYLCAFMDEVYRTVSPLPRTVTHKTNGVVELEEFTLPTDTEVVGNIWGANHDPKTWPDPMKFDPSRHLDEEGNFINSENLIPFGVGPRSCFAEHLARTEVFIVFTKFLQKFEFSPSGSLPGVYDGVTRITYDAKPFQVMLMNRNSDVSEQADERNASD